MARKNTTKKSSQEAVVEEPKTIEEIKEEVITESKDAELENTKAANDEIDEVNPTVEDTNENVNEEINPGSAAEHWYLIFGSQI